MPWPTTSRQSRGYGRAWEMIRLAVLKRDHHLCQCRHCRADGRITVATEVDHVIPKEKGGTDSMGNLQAISAECHRRKTMEDSGLRPRQEIGLDGYPVGE